MVTASHNENGWTGVKMGIKKGLNHAPEEMKELKDITLNEKFIEAQGSEKQINNFQKICYLFLKFESLLFHYQEHPKLDEPSS